MKGKQWWTAVIGAAAVASLTVWGCASTSGDGPTSDGTAGAGAAGAGGEPAQGCVRPLSSLCGDGATAANPSSCPTSPDGALGACSDFRTIVRYPSSCGGVSVSVTFGLDQEIWHFDEQGTLVGAIITSDTGNVCDDGSAVTVYGRTCMNTGPVVNLCREVPAGGGAGAGGAGGADVGGAFGNAAGGVGG